MKILTESKLFLLRRKEQANGWPSKSAKTQPPCPNTSQPDLPTLIKIANILDVDIKDLLNSTRTV